MANKHLLSDYENRVDEGVALNARISRLIANHADLTMQLNTLRMKITQANDQSNGNANNNGAGGGGVVNSAAAAAGGGGATGCRSNRQPPSGRWIRGCGTHGPHETADSGGSV